MKRSNLAKTMAVENSSLTYRMSSAEDTFEAEKEVSFLKSKVAELTSENERLKIKVADQGILFS